MGEHQSSSAANDAVATVIKAVGKFNGTDFEVWRRHAVSALSSKDKGVAAILRGRPCPTPIIERDSERPRDEAGRFIAAEGETSSTGGGDTGTIDYLSSSTAAFNAAGISASAGPSGFAVPGSIMWDMKDNISNSDEIKDWLTSNENLYHFLFLSTTGPAASYLLQFNPEEGMLPDGIAAWKGLISKYKNSTRQRKILLQKELTYRVMPEGQDPDVFFQELFSVRNELKTMGRIVDDDEILGIILNGLPEEYSQVKLLAESQNDFDLNAAMDTMRNMYGNRDAANGLSRIAKGRSSAMTATASTKFCSFCRKKGHTVEECWRKNKLPAEQDPGGRNGDWCTLHRTTRHDNSNCREQQGRHTGSGGGFRGRQQHGRHQGHLTHGNRYNDRDQQGGNYRNFNGNNTYNTNAPAGHHQQRTTNAPQANYGQTSVAPSSTTMVDYYNPAGQGDSGATTASSTSAPPAGIGFSFIADSTAPAPTFTMTVDTGASNHFLDSELLPELEQRVVEYIKIDPPLLINVAGKGQLHGTAKGALKVTVTDEHGDPRPVRLPFICVPNLGRHLFSGGTARKQGVSTIIASTSFIDMGTFKIPIRPDNVCDTLFYFDLAIAPDSVATHHAFSTVSGFDLPPESANAVSTMASTTTSSPTTTPSSTASSTTSGLAAGAPSVSSKGTIYTADASTTASSAHTALTAASAMASANNPIFRGHEPLIESTTTALPLAADSLDIALFEQDEDSNTNVQEQPTAMISSRLGSSVQALLPQHVQHDSRNSPHSTEWAAVRPEQLSGLDHHGVADISPILFDPANFSIIGKRFLYQATTLAVSFVGILPARRPD